MRENIYRNGQIPNVWCNEFSQSEYTHIITTEIKKLPAPQKLPSCLLQSLHTIPSPEIITFITFIHHKLVQTFSFL